MSLTDVELIDLHHRVEIIRQSLYPVLERAQRSPLENVPWQERSRPEREVREILHKLDWLDNAINATSLETIGKGGIYEELHRG